MFRLRAQPHGRSRFSRQSSIYVQEIIERLYASCSRSNVFQLFKDHVYMSVPWNLMVPLTWGMMTAYPFGTPYTLHTDSRLRLCSVAISSSEWEARKRPGPHADPLGWVLNRGMLVQ